VDPELPDRRAGEVDFFSIGTNDLTMYTLAADRGNERVAQISDALHPAVLELIRRTTAAGNACGIWTDVCGELAGDPRAAFLLIGLGVRELSMSASSIPHVKAAVRATDLRRAEAAAREALSLSSAGEVRGLLHVVGDGPSLRGRSSRDGRATSEFTRKSGVTPVWASFPPRVGERFGGDGVPDPWSPSLGNRIIIPRVRKSGSEEPIGPLLGELPRIGEHDRDLGVPNLQPGEPVGDEGGRNVFELEQGGVPPLDHDRSPSDLAQPLHLEGHGSVGDRGHEVLEGLPLDDRDRLRAVGDPVVRGRKRHALRLDVAAGEPVGIALPGVDENPEA